MMESVKRIKSLLDADGGVSDYRINTTKTESRELFFVHKDLETVRSTDTTDIKVTVFVAHDGKLGDATFSVYASYTDEKIKSEIEAAKKKASLIDNQSYELPANEEATFESDSNFKEFELPVLASDIADAVFAADKYEGGSINALEIFIYKDTVNVVNSRGIDKTETKYRAMVEAIPTWNGGEESVELYECYNFTEFSYDEIIAEMLRRFPKAKIVLTLGKDGAVYADAEQKHFQPIFKVRAVDTTAAGDTFTGYFLAGLLNGMPVPEILKMSAKASSIAVTRAGAVPSIPYRDEVLSALTEN